MGSYLAGYNNAQAKFRKTEESSLARAISLNPAFRKAVDHADKRIIARLNDITSLEGEEEMVFSAKWLIPIFTQEADATQRSSVRAEAKRLLQELIRDHCSAIEDEEDYITVAEDAARNLTQFIGQSYEPGQASEFLAELQAAEIRTLAHKSSFYNLVFRLENIAENSSEAAELIDGSGASADAKTYIKFLTDALQQYAAAYAEKVESLLDSEPVEAVRTIRAQISPPPP